MRFSYDPSVDALWVRIKEDGPIVRTVEVRDGLLDLDADGKVVAFELLGASAVIERAAELATNPDLVEVLTEAVTGYAKEAQAELERASLEERSHARGRSDSST
jgi:uncharacterized protein YuzE